MTTETDSDFSTPEDCLKVISALEDAGRIRSQDRALIHAQFNGNPPYTPAEVEEHQIQFNVNKLGGYKIALDANMQVNGALMNKDRFFNARAVRGKVEKREEWGQKFTENIHKPMKRGRSGKKHLYLMQNRNSSLTIDGIGAMVWMNGNDWMPRFASLDDLLIPTDTTLDLSSELCHFGVNSYMTPYQLYQATHSDKVDPGWNVPLANKIITSIPKATPFTPQIVNRPEEMESLFKQHAMFMNSDAVPKVKVTFLYYQNDKTGKWHRKVLFRKTDGINVAEDADETFLYNGKATPFADHIEQILHVQFGAGNVIAPLKFHSVRGLGMLLYAAVESDNRLYCQTLQHTFEQLMSLLRIQNPSQQDRPKILQMKPYAVLEEGISFVPPEERQRVDPRLLEVSLAQNRQLIGESSSSYVQDVDTGTQKEQTLGEAQIKLQSANKVVGGMLSNMYWQESFYYEEVVRRFLNKTSTDGDVVEFRAKCKADGIPEELMVPDAWVIDVEKVFGMGDQTLAVQEVTALMAIVAQLDPSSQIIVRRKYIATITRNPDLARTLVPDDPNKSNSGRQAAEDVFATLMRSIPVSLREGIEQQDYIIAMAEMMAATIEGIKALDNMGTPQDVAGLQTVEQDILKHLDILSENPAMQPLVTGMTKEVGKMMNEVKAFAQRQQQAAEAAAAEQNQDPEAMAKIQALQMQTQAKLQAGQMTTTQKLQASQAKHQQDLKQSAEKHAQAQIQAAATTQASIVMQGAKTKADIAATEKKAAAAPAKTSPSGEV